MFEFSLATVQRTYVIQSEPQKERLVFRLKNALNLRSSFYTKVLQSQTLELAEIKRTADLHKLKSPDSQQLFIAYCRAHHELKRAHIFAHP